MFHLCIRFTVAVATAVILLAIRPLLADELVIDFDSDLQNGGLGTISGDTLTIDPAGSVVTDDDGTHAILVTSDNQIVNFGTIGTTGDNATALLLQFGDGNRNQIENFGNIFSSGTGSILVNMNGDDNLFENSGSLVSDANNAIACGCMATTAPLSITPADRS